MIILNAYAKINLTLDITGLLNDGYHSISTIMQSVSLHDTVTLEKTEVGINLNSASKRIPLDERNIAYRAAKLFFDETNRTDGVSINIRKRIPVSAGLAGGSADAAAVFVGMNRLFNTQLSVSDLMRLSLKLGSDIPFCIIGGTKLCEGRGEIITPLPFLDDCYILIVKPRSGMSAKRSYALYDSFEGEHIRPDTKSAVEKLSQGDLADFSGQIKNVFEPVVAAQIYDVADTVNKLKNTSALAVSMTGSGTAVFAIYNDKSDAEKSKLLFSKPTRTFVTTPERFGVKIN